MPAQLRPAGFPPDEVALAIRGWNLCGGMDWAAIPIAAEILGITDVERFVRSLCAIRDQQKAE